MNVADIRVPLPKKLAYAAPAFALGEPARVMRQALYFPASGGGCTALIHRVRCCTEP